MIDIFDCADLEDFAMELDEMAEGVRNAEAARVNPKIRGELQDLRDAGVRLAAACQVLLDEAKG